MPPDLLIHKASYLVAHAGKHVAFLNPATHQTEFLLSSIHQTIIMKKTNFLFISLLFLAVTACQPKQAKIDNQAIADTILKLEKDWMAANQSRDIEKCLSFSSLDATVMNQGEPIYIGIDAIRKSVEKSSSDSTTIWENFKWNSEKVEISENGDLVIVRGTYTLPMKTPKGTVEMKGKGLDIFKKINGEYKCFISIYNSDM